MGARRDLERAAGPVSRPLGWGPGALFFRWRQFLAAPVPAMAAAAMVLLLVGAVAWDAALLARVHNRESLLTEQQRLLRGISSGARVVQLAGTKAAPDAHGALVQPPGNQQAYLVVGLLPPISGDQVYQVWQITGDTPISAGVFTPSGARSVVVALSVTFSGNDKVGVSIERAGGGATPQGPIVLLGE